MEFVSEVQKLSQKIKLASHPNKIKKKKKTKKKTAFENWSLKQHSKYRNTRPPAKRVACKLIPGSLASFKF